MAKNNKKDLPEDDKYWEDEFKKKMVKNLMDIIEKDCSSLCMDCPRDRRAMAKRMVDLIWSVLIINSLR